MKFCYLELFQSDLLCNLTLILFRGGLVKKTTLHIFDLFLNIGKHFCLRAILILDEAVVEEEELWT